MLSPLAFTSGDAFDTSGWTLSLSITVRWESGNVSAIRIASIPLWSTSRYGVQNKAKLQKLLYLRVHRDWREKGDDHPYRLRSITIHNTRPKFVSLSLKCAVTILTILSRYSVVHTYEANWVGGFGGCGQKATEKASRSPPFIQRAFPGSLQT